MSARCTLNRLELLLIAVANAAAALHYRIAVDFCKFSLFSSSPPSLFSLSASVTFDDFDLEIFGVARTNAHSPHARASHSLRTRKAKSATQRKPNPIAIAVIRKMLRFVFRRTHGANNPTLESATLAQCRNICTCPVIASTSDRPLCGASIEAIFGCTTTTTTITANNRKTPKIPLSAITMSIQRRMID